MGCYLVCMAAVAAAATAMREGCSACMHPVLRLLGWCVLAELGWVGSPLMFIPVGVT